jgi:predicted ArsR family transcriptional regulator
MILTEVQSGAAFSPPRARVLDELQTAGRAMAVDELAERLDLHPNTIRYHLDGLVRDGLVERHSETTHKQGRPRGLYIALEGGPAVGQRSYRMLVEVLAAHLSESSENPGDAALRAGREWGRSLARRPEPYPRLDANESLAQLTKLLTDIGFRPKVVSTGANRRIEQHHCPFGELAATQGEVVCSIHLGVMQGVLTELDSPVQVQDADAFVTPTMCHVPLAARRCNN